MDTREYESKIYGGSMTNTYKLKKSKNDLRYYNKFRITQIGPNSNNKNILSLNSFEIYGNVVRQSKRYTWDESSLTGSHLRLDRSLVFILFIVLYCIHSASIHLRVDIF